MRRSRIGESGMMVALDGTKMKANASLSANRIQEHIEEEVRKMLAEAREKDEEEARLLGKDSRGDEIPGDLKDRRSRLARLKECRERLAMEKEAEKAKANVTEPASRTMKTRKGYIQGYNAQAVVEKGQVILAADVTREANDVHQLHPMTEQARQELRAAGVEEEMKVQLADAGYWSENNMARSYRPRTRSS